MANPIIQNYLSDTSIPKEKREFVLSQVREGGNPTKIASAISQKYGDKYTPPYNFTPEASYEEMNANPDDMSWGEKRAQKKDEGRLLRQRVGGAITETFGAAKAGLQEFGSGVKSAGESAQMEKGKADFIKQQKKLLKTTDKFIKQAQKEGDTEKAQALIQQKADIESQIQEAKGERKQLLKDIGSGYLQAVKGGTDVAISPIVGAVSGGLAPEMEALGQRIGGSERLSSAIQTITENFDKLPPAVQDSVSIFMNVGGLGATKFGSKLAQKASGAALKGVKAGGEGIVSLAKGAKGKVGSFLKTKQFLRPAAEGSKAFENLSKIVSPTLNTKNYKQAVREGRAIAAKKNFWTTSLPSKIELDNRMASAVNSAQKYLPNAGTITHEELPTAIDNVIGEIAQPVREAFKKVEVPLEFKNNLKKTWDKLKKEQMKGRTSLKEAELKRFQKHFEDMVLNKLSNVKKTEGKYKFFRKHNVEDIWNDIIDYDKSRMVQNIKEAVPGSPQFEYKKIWLENRALARRMMDNLADTIDDLDAKQAFRDMSDLYRVKEAALESVAPVKSAKAGVLKEISKEQAIKVGAGVIGGSVLAGRAFGG